MSNVHRTHTITGAWSDDATIRDVIAMRVRNCPACTLIRRGLVMYRRSAVQRRLLYVICCASLYVRAVCFVTVLCWYVKPSKGGYVVNIVKDFNDT